VLLDITGGRINVPSRGGYTDASPVFPTKILETRIPMRFSDDAPIGRSGPRWAVRNARVLPMRGSGGIGRLVDSRAIFFSGSVRMDAWPDVRDAEELHDALLT